jgi:FixJ family two-component response regulator
MIDLLVCRSDLRDLSFFERGHVQVTLAGARLIAVVDDDDLVREATKELIETTGLTARTFASAEAFLDSDHVSRTSCIVADIHMSGLSGFQLHRQLLDSGRDIPMIFITAFPDDRSRERALKAGVVCYLRKPFDPMLLLTCVQSALASRDSKPDA